MPSMSGILSRPSCIDTVIAYVHSAAQKAYGYVTVQAPDPEAKYYRRSATGDVEIVTPEGKSLAVRRENCIREKNQSLRMTKIIVGAGAAMIGHSAWDMSKPVAVVAAVAFIALGQFKTIKETHELWDSVIAGLTAQIDRIEEK